MRSVTVLAIEFYQRVDRSKFVTESSRTQETKRLILKEVTRWKVKSLKQDNNYFFKPYDFVGTENSSPIEVRLIDTETEDGHDLKFGDLNKPSNKDKYAWNDKDPNRMSKALFVRDVLENKVAKLLLSGEIKTVSFSPFDEDDLGSDRLSYFRNMFDKINSNREFSWIQDGNNYKIKKRK